MSLRTETIVRGVASLLKIAFNLFIMEIIECEYIVWDANGGTLKRNRNETSSNNKTRLGIYKHKTFFSFRLKEKKPKSAKKLILRVFSVAQQRVNTICKKMHAGLVIKYKRGEDKRSLKLSNEMQKAKEFISNLKGRENHYG
ncbi:hypothetical protein ILUMI_18025 [Ignelater luminosus]|uniref:Uncharacterized protein n=1 Tax=Ignelater luminosus TaxID=2038154 RepID=A0A8K0G6S8_IGNLU|nr:hypothetical protein ILUMI_18025 [Ignelater luminosus]